jgi:hypothetical protein
MQMNNKSDNMFSENTFTYEDGKNGITNDLMTALYNFVTDRVEELKYRTTLISTLPDFESMKMYKQEPEQEQTKQYNEEATASANPLDKKELADAKKKRKGKLVAGEEDIDGEDDYIDIICPSCGESLSFLASEANAICPYCDTEINL